MANLFFNIPVPAANGSGAAVDVSTAGKSKTISVAGPFVASVTIEISNQLVPTQWSPLATFNVPDGLVVDVAARWMRATVGAYKSGTPACDVGSDDAGTTFATLVAPAGDGVGAAVDVSALPLFKTVTVGGPFRGNVQLEVSEDGITNWSQVGFGFNNPGSQTELVTAHWMRIVRTGTPQLSPGLPLVDIGACPVGGGGGASAGLLSIYGDGSFGDYVTAGDETWSTTLGAPGAPVVPAGSFFPYAYFNNLTISPGDSITNGTLSDTPLEKAVFIFVKDTLTIGAGGNINVNGGDGANNTNGGNGFGGFGRNAVFGSISGGANGGDGAAAFAAGPGSPGFGGSDRPALGSAARVGGVGGNGGAGGINAGGAGGIDEIQPIWPYSLSVAISIASILTAVGGGNGGGGGACGTSSGGGGGGGGAGTLIIFAKNIVAPAGSLQAIGGAGGAGHETENQPGGGGGGGTGGFILIVTEETSVAGIATVVGGAGGLGQGVPQFDGTQGGPGEIVAINPTLAAQIPV